MVHFARNNASTSPAVLFGFLNWFQQNWPHVLTKGALWLVGPRLVFILVLGCDSSPASVFC